MQAVEEKQATGLELARSPCLVIAVTRHQAVPRLREALSSIRPLSVTASEATSWSGHRDVSYRGVRTQIDAQVVRLEIACDERQVAAILDAIASLLDGGSAKERDGFQTSVTVLTRQATR